MTDSYSLLSRDMRFYIHEKGWPSLTKIQNASIKSFYNSENNLILSAATASGKTEAAFLPAISKVSSWDKGVKILYISPLIALINDQFKRISDMCFDMDIPITSWHGEANKSKKDNLITDPKGIVLITPESIEALLSGKRDVAKILFRDLEYIIVDEIHSFMANNRGLQLKSLLERIQRYTYEVPRMIGLSATIGDKNYELAKSFFNNGLETSILIDKSSNELDLTIDYVWDYDQLTKVSHEAIEKFAEYSKEGPMLIFPNAREKVEAISVALGAEVRRNGLNLPIFAHHSSVSKNRREEIETFAKEARGEGFVIIATSTLELGIDIGSVSSVCQYGAAGSVLSLAQRLGRSGRKTRKNILHQFAIKPYDLLQALATVTLYQDGILDAIPPITKAYDVFAHQVLSTLLENYGLGFDEYNYLNKSMSLFSDITDDEFAEITHYMESEGFIEILEDEVIAGVEIDKLMRMGNFYNQFVSSQAFSVYNEKGKIGEVDIRPEIQVDENIYLAGSVWRIEQVLYKNKKVIVSKANEGKAPKFTGVGGADISDIIRERMRQILAYPDIYAFEDEDVNKVLEELREQYDDYEYLFLAGKNDIYLMTFKGTKINRTLAIMFNIMSNTTDFIINEVDGTITGPDIVDVFEDMRVNPVTESQIFRYLKKQESTVLAFLQAYKYMILVPDDLKINYIIKNILDIEGTYQYLGITKDGLAAF